jgi:cell wall-associated NlpC family hydrolase
MRYTGRNILELAFSRLGDSYGWGNIDGKRDCSAYIKDIYRCFGFELPRNSWAQMTLPRMAKDTQTKSEAKKEKF